MCLMRIFQGHVRVLKLRPSSKKFDLDMGLYEFVMANGWNVGFAKPIYVGIINNG